MEPVRNFLRHKKRAVQYYEAEATKIDYEKRIVYINDDSEIKGDVSSTEVPFDMLVVGVGAENATFGKCKPWLKKSLKGGSKIVISSWIFIIHELQDID